ncbi:MAG: hypothetical protein BWZ02_01432 [Lentisphaerae bacterium ADurb.BinA184]|nr:MAG: hypothetical protein BWZ02_01432 [Lentisphaerae bacterium ADurb.BinA184]
MSTHTSPPVAGNTAAREAVAAARSAIVSVTLDIGALRGSRAVQAWETLARHWLPACLVVAAACLLAVLQSVLPTSPALGHAKAPLLTLVVVCAGSRLHLPLAVVVALLAGLLQDALCALPLGLSMALFTLLAGCLAARRRPLEAPVRMRGWVLAAGGWCAAVAALLHVYAWGADGVRCGLRICILNILGTWLLGMAAAWPVDAAHRAVTRLLQRGVPRRPEARPA